jgi:hypothetical protein
MLFITVPPVFTVFSYCFFLSECAYIGTSHLRRLPHSGQYAGVEAPGLGCQPQASQVSGFAKPQPVQKLPSFSARQAAQRSEKHHDQQHTSYPAHPFHRQFLRFSRVL